MKALAKLGKLATELQETILAEAEAHEVWTTSHISMCNAAERLASAVKMTEAVAKGGV